MTSPLAPFGSSREKRDWLVALGLATAPVVALGFSRFAYALLLPPMKHDMHWTFTQAGGMNTANAVGYVLGAITAAWAARHLTTGRAFLWSFLLSAAVLLASGLTSSYVALIALRSAGGYTTAVSFVIGSALAARLRPALLPIYFAGPGIGIVLSSLIVPAALAHDPTSGWKLGWVVLGLVATAAFVGASRAEAHVPDHEGRHAATLSREQFRRLGPMFGAYVLFGAGYVSFMTFVIELLRDKGVGNWTSGAFFLLLGATSAAATFLWGQPLSRLTGGRGLAAVSAITLIGSLPVIAHASIQTAFVSAVIFGGSFMSGPTAVTAFCRRCLPTHAWAAGIAVMTTGFALGQAIGPVISGLISDHVGGGVTSGLWLSPFLLAAAGVTALRQRDYAPETAVAELAEDAREEAA
jgi:predicted MFS family arabinose efflux permease